MANEYVRMNSVKKYIPLLFLLFAFIILISGHSTSGKRLKQFHPLSIKSISISAKKNGNDAVGLARDHISFHNFIDSISEKQVSIEQLYLQITQNSLLITALQNGLEKDSLQAQIESDKQGNQINRDLAPAAHADSVMKVNDVGGLKNASDNYAVKPGSENTGLRKKKPVRKRKNKSPSKNQHQATTNNVITQNKISETPILKNHITDSISFHFRNKVNSEKEKISELKKYSEQLNLSIATLETEKGRMKLASNILTLKLSGSDTIKFKGVNYFVFLADIDSVNIKTNWKGNGAILRNINALFSLPEFNKNPPLMATNGGMYNPDNSPEGLLIEDGTELAQVNTKSGDGNFYLRPNGIFYIDDNANAYISETENYIAKALKVKQATQSGPLLVINNRIHPAFKRGSDNRKIRSGVGIINERHVVFIISIQPVNFYDFATLFKDIYSCADALFLDGVISKMYLKDLNPNERGGDFGTIISVTKNIPNK